MSESNYQTLRYEVEEQIARITLDRPPANLINLRMTQEYHGALRQADVDPEVRVIILCGAGEGLSAGVDLKYIENFNSTEMKEYLRLFYVGTMKQVRSLSKPIIAAVHGYAREGACTLAFSCDMIIAADDADFGYPGVPNLAAPPGMHVWILQRLIGRMKAAELIFTGKSLGAAQAERMGLITKVVGAGCLLYEAEKIAQRMAQMSPLALRRTRDLMYQMEDMNFGEVPEAAVEALSAAFDSEDSKEARKAFIEKRKPVWTGK
ncbi:MAG: enoyl-CoA hydratase/isomerase family protein [Gammaproteobacteria bacterium]|jgi:enoyl-CoA hydratase|nr:enoyl-CoA hydratase/isomerase family protein [Gammaproteobacteria bacterium]